MARVTKHMRYAFKCKRFSNITISLLLSQCWQNAKHSASAVWLETRWTYCFN